MQLDNVLYEVRGPMALITINRAEKHNAISLATLEDLHTAVDAAAWDDDVRVITITGAGGKAAFVQVQAVNLLESRLGR